LILLAVLIAVMPDIIRLRAMADIPTTWRVDTLNIFLAGRLKSLWIPASKAFLENPLFGRGVNGAGIYILGQAHPIYPHSGYVATLCDIGIVGLICMLWLFVAFWKFCGKIYHQTKHKFTRRLALACKAQIMVLMFSNLTSDHSFFYQPMVVAPFFLSVAILFAMFREEVAMKQEERPTLHEEELVLASPL
jgi:O-antigen ligase